MRFIAQRLVVFIAAAAGYVAVAYGDQASSPPIQANERAALFATSVEIEDGRGLAQTSCASCHGMDGISADPRVPHLAGQSPSYMYRELVAYKQGRRSDESMIAAAKFLSEDAFVKVSAYYASLELSARAGRETAQGGDGSEADDAAAGDPLAAARAAAACAGCHGEDGNSAVPGMPNLTAQHPEYLADATRAYGDSRRKDDIMKSIIASFGDETIAAVSLYFALQQPRGTGAAITGDVAAGRKAAEACSGCHGADGNATAPDTPSLAGQDPTYAAKALKAYRDGGRDHPGMSPAAAELSDTDVDALVAFYATQPPVARDVPKPLSVTEWVQRCDRCHGHDGNSTDPRFPSLAGQKGVYLLRVLQEYQSGIRKSEMMHKMSEALRPSDLNLIAGYYAAKRRKSVIYVAVPGQ